ncbi:uncharacterized protein OCT59_015443 [Rhizophagus irregularis]|uniref:uncharacterized protein n=1 Tax=Rhizophagus irregularis TaxID=588596 RepID=UPI0033299B27|nr:hypothetical protein OCT59_015443 [Rhizophagus irregularis]
MGDRFHMTEFQLIWHANPDNRRSIHSKKRLKFPDYCKAMRLCNYLNFTLFTFNKIRILFHYCKSGLKLLIFLLQFLNSNIASSILLHNPL